MPTTTVSSRSQLDTSSSGTSVEESVMIPLCELPPLLPGYENKACLDTATWFTFDKTTGQCIRFTYSGCGKSANLFPSEEECRRACIRRSEQELDISSTIKYQLVIWNKLFSGAEDTAKPADDCLLICTSEYIPMCASNNVTYANDCGVRAAACREKLELTILYKGECRGNNFGNELYPVKVSSRVVRNTKFVNCRESTKTGRTRAVNTDRCRLRCPQRRFLSSTRWTESNLLSATHCAWIRQDMLCSTTAVHLWPQSWQMRVLFVRRVWSVL